MNNLTVPDQYADTLHKLDQLSRNHLLFFRLEVGKLLLAQFFNGDPAAYLSKDSNKPQSFNNFIATCAVHLGDIGLSEAVVRQCIVAHLVVQSLPPLTANKLPFSQVLELTKVEDTATRGLLAHAAVENHWTTRDLRGAVDAARAGIWIDGDLKTPGLQPPQSVPHSPGAQPPPLPHYSEANRPQAGRVVARFERAFKLRENLACLFNDVLQDLPSVRRPNALRCSGAVATAAAKRNGQTAAPRRSTCRGGFCTLGLRLSGLQAFG